MKCTHQATAYSFTCSSSTAFPRFLSPWNSSVIAVNVPYSLRGRTRKTSGLAISSMHHTRYLSASSSMISLALLPSLQPSSMSTCQKGLSVITPSASAAQHLIVAADEDQRDILIGQVAGSI